MSKMLRVFVVTIPLLMLALTPTISAGQGLQPSTAEINNWIVVTLGDDANIGRSLLGSNMELGADRVVISTPTDSGGCPANGGYPNLQSIFSSGSPSRWNTATTPDSVTGAAEVFEGTDFSGDVALTSDNGGADVTNSVIFGASGINGVLTNPLIGTSGSLFEDTGDTTTDCSAATALALGNGGIGGQNFNQLLTDLQLWKDFLSGLATELTIDDTTIDDFKDISNQASNGIGGMRTNYDSLDTNGDDVVVIDIDPDGVPDKGDPFKVENIDWVIEGAGNKLIVFRLLHGSDMEVSNASIQMGENYASSPLRRLGAIFLSYQEEDGSSNTVFNAGSSVVLSGIAWWDLNVVGEGGPRNINTIINYNGSQGCGQLIGQRVNLQNARWSRCSLPAYEPTAISLSAAETKSMETPLWPFIAAIIALGLASIYQIVLIKRRRRVQA